MYSPRSGSRPRSNGAPGTAKLSAWLVSSEIFHPATSHGPTVPTSVNGTIAMAVAIHEVDG